MKTIHNKQQMEIALTKRLAEIQCFQSQNKWATSAEILSIGMSQWAFVDTMKALIREGIIKAKWGVDGKTLYCLSTEFEESLSHENAC